MHSSERFGEYMHDIGIVSVLSLTKLATTVRLPHVVQQQSFDSLLTITVALRRLLDVSFEWLSD